MHKVTNYHKKSKYHKQLEILKGIVFLLLSCSIFKVCDKISFFHQSQRTPFRAGMMLTWTLSVCILNEYDFDLKRLAYIVN